MNTITTLKTTYSVSDFVSWYKAGSLILSPNFQRRPVWKAGAKSYLIDTVIRGLPIPIIFLRDLPSDLTTFAPKREVVDGQQRLRTVISFVAPHVVKDYDPNIDDFRISKSHQKEFARRKFADLPASIQQSILDYQFSVHSFAASTDDREILEIFGRMNSTGIKLNAQELRNACYYGEFKTVAFELASEQLTRWRDWHVFTEYNLARMDEVELTSELMVLELKGITEKSGTVIDKAYADYDDRFDESEEVAKRLRQVMDTIESRFAPDMRTAFSKRTVFYCLFAAVYDVQFGLGSSLKTRRASPLTKRQAEQMVAAGHRLQAKEAPASVIEATQRRTSHAKSRRLVTNW